MGIEEKFEKLNPAGQDAVMAFIDFLLFREAERGRTAGEDDEYEEKYPLTSPELGATTRISPPDQPSGKSDKSGIILAEERFIDDKDDIIDFADINTRFSQKENEKDDAVPVRKRKMFDWL